MYLTLSLLGTSYPVYLKKGHCIALKNIYLMTNNTRNRERKLRVYTGNELIQKARDHYINKLKKNT